MTMYTMPAVSAAILTSFLAGTVTADVLEVPGEYGTIQAAIDAASDGDTVLVSAGTYFEGISFLGKEITVESVSGSADTTIHGDGLTVSIVRCNNGETANSVLRGFRLYKGVSGTQDFTESAYLGGGMYIREASPTVEDVIFEECRSGTGGGLYAIWSDSQIIDCTFLRCISDSNSGAAQAFFNGVTFEGCDFIENWCSDYGGAVHAIQGYHVFNNCTFLRNGGPYYSDTITYCDDGGAISWDTFANDSLPELPRLTITNCLMEGNRSSQEGGGLWVKAGYDSVDMSGTVICGNSLDNVSGRITDLGGNTVCDCEGDFNGDGIVNGADFGALLAAWGPCADCPEDLNGDGTVSGADVGLILSYWGDCTP